MSGTSWRVAGALAGMAMAGWTMAFAAEMGAAPDDAAGTQLIRDPHFELGLNVYDPKTGKKVVRDVFHWHGETAEPVWGMAQWSSKHSLAGTKPEALASGAVRYANEARSVVWGPVGTEQADLALGVDSRQEWGTTARTKGQPWPHLLVEQKIEGCPRLVDLASLRFHLEAKLLHAERFETPTYDRRLHAAHFQAFFTVQNRNEESAGRGDFLWFGVPVYDDRDRIPRTHVSGDKASGKMIYTPPGETYTTQSLHDGQWVTIDKDLLPLMMDALKAAWEKGFLKDSRDVNDFGLGSMNMGWEVSGINDVDLQFRNIGLTAAEKGGKE